LKVFVQFSGRIGSIGSLNCIVSATLTVEHHCIVIVGTDRLWPSSQSSWLFVGQWVCTRSF